MNAAAARVQAPRILDRRNHLDFLDHLLDHADAGHREVVVSFSQTLWVDGSGLNALLAAHRYLAAWPGGGLRVADLNDELGTRFAAAGMAEALLAPAAPAEPGCARAGTSDAPGAAVPFPPRHGSAR